MGGGEQAFGAPYHQPPPANFVPTGDFVPYFAENPLLRSHALCGMQWNRKITLPIRMNILAAEQSFIVEMTGPHH